MRYFLWCTAILALIVPVANVEAGERVILKKEFSEWRDQLTQWREAKLAEPDLPNEMTFDNIMPAPDDPALWPLWRDWLTRWREDQRKALNYDDKYYRAKEFAWVPSNLVSTKIMSWGQSKPWKTWLFKDSHAPGVVRNKWFERRHVVYPTNRWIPDRTGNLHTSWMNGTGTLVCENRFGCWDGWSPRDRSILRSMIPCGNTWEWTESERSNEGRSRFSYIRGGSFYKVRGSGWYAKGGPQPCNHAAKFLLVWPGLDRCSTIGFRCTVDLAGMR